MIGTRLQILFLLAILVTSDRIVEGGQWYVSPGGEADNAGTREAPWDIESALSAVIRFSRVTRSIC